MTGSKNEQERKDLEDLEDQFEEYRIEQIKYAQHGDFHFDEDFNTLDLDSFQRKNPNFSKEYIQEKWTEFI